MLFARDKRQEVKLQKPELSFGDLSMEVAQMWKGLSDDSKKVRAPHIFILTFVISTKFSGMLRFR
jgi:hypothetical protein